jgi:hypothetical protein
MKWSAVLMLVTYFFLITNGFSLNSVIHRKSNDIVPDTPSDLMKFDENRVKIHSSRMINNNEIANKLKRSEEENDEFTEEDSEEVYYYDVDDDEDEVVDKEDDNGKGNEDHAEDHYNDEDKDESEYVYHQLNIKDIPSEENNGIKYETKLLRVTRRYVFESSKDTTKPIPTHNNTNYNIKNDDNDRDNKSYNNFKYQDSDIEDDRNDDDVSERNTREKIWPTLGDDKGVTAVADYIVDYVQSASSHEEDGKSKCLFGWRLDANGVCAPPGRECDPGLVRNAEGNCIGPHTGYWYK